MSAARLQVTDLTRCRRRPLAASSSSTRQKVLVDVLQRDMVAPRSTQASPPSLYVLNAAAITKPHAIEHLAAELMSYNIDVAVIAETHQMTLKYMALVRRHQLISYRSACRPASTM